MTQPFVHLRIHSEFSLIDGLVRIKPAIARAQELQIPALAITDQCNLFGQIKFYRACLGAGIKPITAADFWLSEGGEGKPTLITLYALNGDGYRNITELISRAWMEGQYHGNAYIKREWIKEYSEGVLMLSGAKYGDVGRALIAGRRAQAQELASEWAELFPGRYYLELQRTGRAGDEDYLHAAVELAQLLNLPVVATNDVRFMEESEFEAHEVRVCIHEGRALDDPRRERRYSAEQYFRSPEEMWELFSDIPEALENTVEIAKRCSAPIQLGKYFLPEYPIPEGMTEDQFFEKVSYEGMERRLEAILDTSAADYAERRKLYEERLRFELDIIVQMGFPGYFLIVMDFIQWAKDQDIPVGPGRGSGAGSLVAYSLDITDLDPLQYDLLFERFLNPERVSMPDFDIDFCMEKRDRVIGYVADNYGRQAVSQIITFGTMAAKAVVRDVARVQGKSYGLADKLSKMIPLDVGMTLQKAFDQEEILREFLDTDDEGQEIWEMALQLEGVSRNVGKHAGGVVIAPTKLTDFAPLYCDETGAGLVTQFDKNDVEDAGLVKFDFLGLRTLTIIDWAKRMVDVQREREGLEPLDIAALPLDDAETFKMLKRAETTAVFQLESRGMKDLIKRLQPDNLEDMIALVALFRPGPLQSGMVDDFINRKHGRAQVAYPDAKYQHEKLQPILEPTYGVIVYQEQVMQIAQELAGYTLGGADLLRRAMGKKKPEEMAKQRATFENGAKEQGINPELAIKIFDLVEKFAGYGFNKSHSAAYALVSYQTAWLKAHYPSQFMAATMSSDMDKTDKVVTFIEECRAMELVLVPPDVNLGSFQFSVDIDKRIIYGLGAIKGLGEGPIENIIAAREEGGPFVDLFDFCSRIDPRKVNKRALEALVRSGAFDSIGPDTHSADGLDYSRAVLFNTLDEAVKAADQQKANANAGMMDLFGEVVPQASEGDVYEDFRRTRCWSIRERLEGEKNTLGLYLTGHPIDEYAGELKHLVKARIADLKPGRESQKVAGLVVAMRVMKTKRGDSMAIVTLDDRSGRIEAAIFSEALGEHRDKLAKDALLVLEGPVATDDYSGGLKMTVNGVSTLDELRQSRVTGVRLRLDSGSVAPGLAKRLAACLQPYTGGQCGVSLEVSRHDARGLYRLPLQWNVEPNDQMVQSLRELLGREQVTLQYAERR
ncbi:DNA polymerase III subunit alpha [Microbulbifer sp. OS29]|uniref:DNA polymerase III subunit alpha n=1 Tax=Microbulbifer okhotskensis TaxID=2926617 RepID=A0A9X2J5N9_9GAMM|nr:DNA polymerase III subunit alpha [Microbulbifer okhotskensis]MCO1334604.1 DNA polymerase III subunit alpha [Microbulbifer okhotskensis]